MNLRSMKAVLAASVVGVAMAMPSIELAAQGRPSTPPGQANRPANPPPKPAGPATPPGQTNKATPAVQPKVATPVVVNTALAKNLQPLLPGLDVNAQAQGFKNLGAFVSAVHVSHNLDIPFATLKSRIVGDGMSLGGAIQTLKPAVNANSEAARAEKQAKAEIAQSKGR